MFPQRSLTPTMSVKKYSKGILNPLNKAYKQKLDRELATRYLEMKKVQSLQRFEKNKIERLRHNFDTRAGISKELGDVLLTKTEREKLLNTMPEPSSSILYEKPESPYLKELVKINLYSIKGKQVQINRRDSLSPTRSSRLTPIRMMNTERTKKFEQGYIFRKNRLKRNKTPFFLTDLS